MRVKVLIFTLIAIVVIGCTISAPYSQRSTFFNPNPQRYPDKVWVQPPYEEGQPKLDKVLTPGIWVQPIRREGQPTPDMIFYPDVPGF